MRYKLNFTLFLRNLILLSGIGIMSILSSCNINKFLNEDQLLVEEVTMNIDSDNSNLDKANLKEELIKLYKIQPNHDRKSYRYFKYKDLEDPPWIRRWLKNKMSKVPSLLDTTLVEETALSIEQYLKNKKGYYQAEVDYAVKTKPRSKRASINYTVSTATRYTLNEVRHLSLDSMLIIPLKEIEKESIIQAGDPVDALTLDLEKQRIVSEFQRKGYADFNLTNIEVKGDSTDLEKSWDLFIIINPPAGVTNHRKYTIGDIKIYTDYHQYQQKTNLTVEKRFNKEYYKESSKFLVRPSTLNRKIYLEKNKTYNSDDYYKTLRKLYGLGTYRFAKIAPEISTKDSSTIDYNILLTPHSNKWSLDLGLESFFSTLNVIDDQLIGIAYSAGLEDRNAFGGSERFKASIESGIEFNPNPNPGSGNRFLNSISLGLNTELEIPTLTRPLNVIRLLNHLNLIKDGTVNKLEEEGVSTLSQGINYVDILRYYKIFAINARYGYDFVLNSKNRITFNQIGINYTDYSISRPGLFEPILRNNLVLQNSFQDNLFTGFLFNDLTYFFQSDKGKTKSNWALISSLELSGLEVYLANKLSNAITGNEKVWKFSSQTEFEQMVKVEFDARWYSKSRRRTQLAARFKTGLAVPFGNDNTVSYIKQFFVGGPSSLRAWRPMHLGPGTFISRDFFEPTSQTVFFQRGDINLEMNLEYRFDLLWLMEGALFVDAGNIWTLEDDVSRPGSKFGTDFLSELAIGYGYGIRFDFNYFLIRFDLGIKLLYPSYQFSESSGPYIEPTSRWVSPKGQGIGNFNIAVNYPF